MFGKSVYIETSIVSYLTALPSRDILVAAWQKSTAEWWESQRGRFDLFSSLVVMEEASRGDPVAAAKRLKALSGIPLLVINEPVRMLSKSLLQEGALPAPIESN